MDKITEILQEVQISSASNKATSRKIATFMQQIANDAIKTTEAINALLRYGVDNTLVVTKKEPTVEKVINFISDFLASSNSSELIFARCMTHLLERTTASDKTVRFRACQIISNVLANMPVEAEISDELWDSLISHLTPRLRDKNLNVRIWAVKAVERIQNPDDDKDFIMGELIRLMKSDPSPLIRISSLENIRITKRTLPFIIERLRDVKNEVRLCALKRLGKEVNYKYLNASFRNAITRSGLKDRDPAIRKATIDVISKWIAACDNRIPSLLHLLQLQVYEEDAAALGWAILEAVDKGDIQNPALKQLIREQQTSWEASFASMNPSEILWTKVRCDYARAKYSPAVAADVLDTLLPDIVVLCDLLADGCNAPFSSSPVQMLTMRYLLDLTSFLESSDVCGKERLTELCLRLIKDHSFPDDLVVSVLEAWARCEPAETMTAISCELALAVKASGELYPEDSEERDLSGFRCLDIFLWTLGGLVCANSGRDIDFTGNEKYTTLINVIWESLQKPNSEFRCLAVKGLGLLGLCSERLCCDNYQIILQVACNDMEENEIRCQAVQILSDFAMIYPTKFSNDAKFAYVLARLQENSDATTARVALECAAKLVFSKLMSDSKLVANLIKFFFVPETFAVYYEDNQSVNSDSSLGSSPHLQQILSVFFQAIFSFGSDRLDLILGSISSLMSDVALLIRNGEFPSDVVDKITGHVIDLVRRAAAGQSAPNSAKMTSQVQSILSANICKEILKLGNTKIERAALKDYVKALCSMSPDQWLTSSLASEATQVAEQIFQTSCTDKTSLKMMEKHLKNCQAVQQALTPESIESAGTSFCALAPGLADLVETSSVVTTATTNSSDRRQQPAKSTSEKRRPTKKAAVVESEDDEDIDEISYEEEESVHVNSSTKTSRAQTTRATKTKAVAKIADDMEIEEDNENDENVSRQQRSRGSKVVDAL